MNGALRLTLPGRFRPLPPILTFAVLVGVTAWRVAAQQSTGPTSLLPAPAPFVLIAANTGLPEDGRWKSTPLVTDVNDDRWPDLIVHPRLARSLRAWLGDGKGTWTESSRGLLIPQNATCGGGIRAADVNRDRHIDLVLADHCHGIFVFLGNGKGQWQVVTQALNPMQAKKYQRDGENPFAGAEDLAVGDVNGDRRLDIVAGASDRGGFTIWLGDGSGKKWKEAPFSGLPTVSGPGEGSQDDGGWCREVLLRDMNGDKTLDVVASYHRGPRVWVGDGKGGFVAASKGLPAPVLFGVFGQIGVADVNDDGRPDIVVANTVNGPEVFLQNADHTWSTTPDVMGPMRGGATAVAAGDLDGDGHIDLVTGGRLDSKGQYGLFVLMGDGRGGWTRVTTPMAEDRQQVVWGVALADLNADKRLDIVATLGGSMGALRQTPGKPSPDPETHGTVPHLQVWLNTPKGPASH